MGTPYVEVNLGTSFELAVGIRGGAEVLRDVELLKGNGVTEKIFLKKLPEKPYSWIGSVLAVAIRSLGQELIGQEARKEYLTEGVITLPTVLKKMPLADANSCLLEIHRRLWQNLVPRQQCLCKFCGGSFIMDVDLNRIEMSDENKAFSEAIRNNPDKLVLCADLPDGLEFVPFQKTATDGIFKNAEFEGLYNRLVYRVPTLEDAIRNEKFASDEVVFWRRVAFDCLQRIEQVSNPGRDNEEVTLVLPHDMNTALGIRLYDQTLSGRDLKAVRTALREKLPVLPFGYEETCPKCERETPIAMEATNFFSA